MFTSVIIITVTLLIITMVALIRAFIYKRQKKKAEAVKQNSKNNDIHKSSRVPMNWDDNLCY